MISHNHKLVFVRVAKAATTTILHTFKQSGVFFDTIHPSWWQHDPNHVPLWGILNSCPKSSDYFKFAFVRNPWDRLVSAYHYARKWHSWNNKPLPKHLLSFELFVRHGMDLQPKYSECQYSWVDGCDFIGKVETFSSDMFKLSQKIDISLECVDVMNTTTHNHYREYYTSLLRDMVAERFSTDIDEFDYSF